ncbi:MAG: RNA-directed DNA polymerase [Dehalococcoidales bacterium]|nr:RNA-directed DNA polymerase [Dehalococcoidales bacterium]
MKKIIDLSNTDAREFLLKGSSYFSSDLPPYLSFEPLITEVATELNEGYYPNLRDKKQKIYPQHFENVNYLLLSNKDGRFDWRPMELIHPLIYISLVNLICKDENWNSITNRWSSFQGGMVDCCSCPVSSENDEKDKAAQVTNWWNQVEQQSLIYSLEFSHVLHTDVTNCYGSLYTHSIAWAIHGFDEAKKHKNDMSYLGNLIDAYIKAGRYGQTNGISQGSVLMDFIAEIVLGYVDSLINEELVGQTDFRILRYRDDYRIFANNDERCERILKVISEKLLFVGMKLGNSKTNLCRNVVEGAIKADKLAGISLQDLGSGQTLTMQKKLLRLHSFGQHFPNSGTLRRLVSDLHSEIYENLSTAPPDLEVQVAIATDIGFDSPSTFPAIAGILSKLISLAPAGDKVQLWDKVRKKMARVPNNGYLDIWLQRVIVPKEVGLKSDSNEPICKIVNRESTDLWNNHWIIDPNLRDSLDLSKIVIGSVSDTPEVMNPQEIELYRRNLYLY